MYDTVEKWVKYYLSHIKEYTGPIRILLLAVSWLLTKEIIKHLEFIREREE